MKKLIFLLIFTLYSVNIGYSLDPEDVEKNAPEGTVILAQYMETLERGNSIKTVPSLKVVSEEEFDNQKDLIFVGRIWPNNNHPNTMPLGLGWHLGMRRAFVVPTGAHFPMDSKLLGYVYMSPTKSNIFPLYESFEINQNTNQLGWHSRPTQDTYLLGNNAIPIANIFHTNENDRERGRERRRYYINFSADEEWQVMILTTPDIRSVNNLNVPVEMEIYIYDIPFKKIYHFKKTVFPEYGSVVRSKFKDENNSEIALSASIYFSKYSNDTKIVEGQLQLTLPHKIAKYRYNSHVFSDPFFNNTPQIEEDKIPVIFDIWLQ